ASGVELRAISGGDNTDFALGNHRHLGDRYAEEVRVNRPQARGQRAKLNAFDASLGYEGDRVLKVVVRVHGAIGREDATGGHWISVDGFDYTQLIGTDFDQGDFADHLLERPLDQMETRLEYFSLDADFARRSNDAAWRHPAAEVASFLDRDFAPADVHQDAGEDEYQHDERYRPFY